MNHYYLEREILFKGKSPYCNNWYYGSLVKSTVSKKLFISNAEAFPAEVIPETVGQYTGFNDINKNKIFEWDIVQNINTKETALVQWFQEYAAFMLYNKRKNKVYFLYDNDFNNIEVIGHIYDNPELLKGE